MKPTLGALLTLTMLPLAAAADNGIVNVQSRHSVAETLDRLRRIAESKGVQVFARIDHSGEAEKVGIAMRPTQLLIFGNPKAGSPLMNAAPTAALDLPLKALAWEDAQGKVWVSYNSPGWLIARHGLDATFETNVAAIAGLIAEAAE